MRTTHREYVIQNDDTILFAKDNGFLRTDVRSRLTKATSICMRALMGESVSLLSERTSQNML